MDFSLSEPQALLRETARAFFTNEFPPARLREVEAQGLGAFLTIHRKLGALGFLGAAVPEDLGGAGGDWLDVALFNEEAGRALLPAVHLSCALTAQALLALGSDAQRREHLPRLVAGETIVTPAHVEAAYDEPGALPQTRLETRGDGVVLRGAKRFVEDFTVASALLVTARDSAGRGRLVLVPRDGAGLRPRTWTLQSLDQVADVVLEGVVAAPDALLPGAWEAWLAVLDAGKIALAAYAVGAAQAALDMAVAYSKVRVQFDRPIGSFQALQHKLADAAMHIEQARTLVHYAAWLRDRRDACAEEAAMAKLLAGRALKRAAYASTLAHGGYGFMEEQDIQLFFRRAKLLEHRLGSPQAQAELILPGAARGGA